MPEAGSPTQPVVLIVDDEKPNLAAFSRLFRRDFAVRTAASADEALRALESEPVDVVLSDYTMPGMSGTDLLEIVARRWPGIARVIVSGHGDLDEVRTAQDSGIVQALLPKPWDREGVLHLVTDLARATRH